MNPKSSLSQSGSYSFSFSDNFDLEAKRITLRIRWFGLLIGFILVSLIDSDTKENGLMILKAILTLGSPDRQEEKETVVSFNDNGSFSMPLISVKEEIQGMFKMQFRPGSS